ncbi:MAG: hypothetical protein WCG47_33190 [Dermatophilaceae bacterium]
MLAVGLVLLLRGLLLRGYDQGVVSGALNGIQKEHPNTVQPPTGWAGG